MTSMNFKIIGFYKPTLWRRYIFCPMLFYLRWQNLGVPLDRRRNDLQEICWPYLTWTIGRMDSFNILHFRTNKPTWVRLTQKISIKNQRRTDNRLLVVPNLWYSLRYVILWMEGIDPSFGIWKRSWTGKLRKREHSILPTRLLKCFQ